MEFGIRVDSQQLAQSAQGSTSPRAQLAAWQVGQVLRAFVLEGTPAQAGGGPARLQIGNLQIPVRSQTPLQTGESLRLSVRRAGNDIVLARAPAMPPSVSPQTVAIEQAVRSLLPAQQALDTVLRALSRLLPQLPAAAAGPARALVANTPTPAQLATGGGLKQAMLNSGVMLESRLAAGLPPSPLDIKATAARLLDVLPVQPTTQPAASNQARQMVEGLIGRIGINQLQSQVPGSNTLYWSIELPVRTPQGFHTVQLEVETTPPHTGTPPTDGQDWVVRLHLDLPQTGPLDAYVASQQNTLSAHFWTANAATATRISNALPELAAAWSAQGLSPGILQSHRGEAPQARRASSGANGLVDTRA